MPVLSQIANAASSYRQNESMLRKSFEGLTTEEWLRRPNESSNHLLWIAGHVIWARGVALGFLGSEWSRPWLPLFARGSKLVDSAQYPTPEEIALAGQEISERLTTAMEEASEETLSKPSPEKIPSADGKISGVLNFLAWHEAYHVGQAAYVRCWLGHSGVAG
jgi:hypothetical protein